MLWHFLHFRLEVVTARLEHELGRAASASTSLEGFEKVFDALDEILKIVRKSEGKADAAQKIIAALRARRRADRRHPRAEALSPGAARDSGHPGGARRRSASAAARSARCSTTKSRPLGHRARGDRRAAHADPAIGKDKRRTQFDSGGGEVEYSAEDFIVAEDDVVLVTRDGWIKRQKDVKDLATTRLREGDAVLAVVAGSTRATRGLLHATTAPPTPAASSTSPRRPATASRSRGSSSSRTASASSRP